MPRIEADFSGISSSFEALAAGEYIVKIDDIEESETKENKLPQMVFKMSVQEGDKKDSVIFDYVTLKQNDGKVNKIGLGRIKAYAEAILGEAAANDTSGIDTDELKGGRCQIIVESRTYEKDGAQQTGNKIKKVLAA